MMAAMRQVQKELPELRGPLGDAEQGLELLDGGKDSSNMRGSKLEETVQEGHVWNHKPQCRSELAAIDYMLVDGNAGRSRIS